MMIAGVPCRQASYRPDDFRRHLLRRSPRPSLLLDAILPARFHLRAPPAEPGIRFGAYTRDGARIALTGLLLIPFLIWAGRRAWSAGRPDPGVARGAGHGSDCGAITGRRPSALRDEIPGTHRDVGECAQELTVCGDQRHREFLREWRHIRNRRPSRWTRRPAPAPGRRTRRTRGLCAGRRQAPGRAVHRPHSSRVAA